jgi:hypothetical protein
MVQVSPKIGRRRAEEQSENGEEIKSSCPEIETMKRG